MSVTGFLLPPPLNWQEFEILCRDLFAEIWNDPTTQLNGRSGQQQAGVDIFGKPKDGAGWAGIVCKASRSLNTVDISYSVQAALEFTPQLSYFIVATTAARDVKTQERVRKIADSVPFQVSVYFWDDFILELSRRPNILQAHYGALALGNQDISSRPLKQSVFVAYSHDSEAHRDRIVAFTSRLRADGVDAVIDLNKPWPSEGWQAWTRTQLRISTHVVLVITEIFNQVYSKKNDKSRDVNWGGSLLSRDLFSKDITDAPFILVVFTENDRRFTPSEFQGLPCYNIGASAGYEALYRRITGQAEVAENSLGQMRNVPPANIHFERPEVPESLVRACRNRSTVLYAGAGLSANSGYPTWTALITELLDRAAALALIDKEYLNALNESLVQGETSLVADNIVSAFSESPYSSIQELRRIFKSSSEQPSTHRILGGMKFRAVLTTNFDNLLENTFASSEVMTPSDTDELQEYLRNGQPFLLKLYGDLARERDVMISPAQFYETISGNRKFSNFMETLFYSHTILFIGCSLDGILAYLGGIQMPTSLNMRHFALIDVRSSSWETKARLLQRRYGIEVLPYTPTDESHPEVLDFLSRLDEETANESLSIQATRDELPSKIVKVTVENIGPFRNLSVTFDPQLTILLGDNGVGKSHILRAIALALLGEEAKPWAAQLIRSGAEVGSVIMESNRRTYRTVIRKLSSGIEVESFPPRPLEDPEWLAIGFPAIRSIAGGHPRGPELLNRSRRRPLSEDLMPLFVSAPDSRIDGIKQWLVNLDYQSKAKPGLGLAASNADDVVGLFFVVLSRLTRGLECSLDKIDSETNSITVRTEDGVVPIDAISQGTASLMGWIGLLLRRLSEVPSAETEISRRPAIVLVDEVDVHMHPAWQRHLLGTLIDVFPNVQFIVTTHSALVVGGQPPERILRLIRTPEGVSPIELADDSTMGRVDQVLTSKAFDIDDTIDPKSAAFLFEYRQLFQKAQKSKGGISRLKLLETELGFRLPYPENNTARRRAFELLEAVLEEKVGVAHEGNISVLQRAAQLLDEIIATRRGSE